MLKRPLYLISLFMLALSISAVANVDNTLNLDAGLNNPPNNQFSDQMTSMTWPMLPGESLNDVARLFYPKSKVMQKYFVAKALSLSADIVPNLSASQRFEQPTLLLIPTLKSLSQKAARTSKSSKNQSLKMSYGLKRVIQLAPEKLQQEYEELVSKNAFLKEKLAQLNEKIAVLQAKLDDLKLIFDKTLSLPKPVASTELPASDAAPAPVAASEPALAEPTVTPAETPISEQTAVKQAPAKKVFKNLNDVKKPAPITAEPAAESRFFDNLNMDLVKAAIAAAVLLLLGTLLLKKYRERMFAKLSFAATKMQNTVTDFSGYFDKTSEDKKDLSPEAIMQQKAAQEVESRLNSTLEEAKLLMSVNRSTDAIAHLKMTIEAQPKASINHWLYLLEVFRKLNLKDDFEDYASKLHQTFNVMTPVWYEKEAAVAIVVPQSLEEFPHIMQRLYGVWPGELASVYLRGLITDNRGGDRAGFGKAVVAEILCLIELLDTYKDIPN